MPCRSRRAAGIRQPRAPSIVMASSSCACSLVSPENIDPVTWHWKSCCAVSRGSSKPAAWGAMPSERKENQVDDSKCLSAAEAPCRQAPVDPPPELSASHPGCGHASGLRTRVPARRGLGGGVVDDRAGDGRPVGLVGDGVGSGGTGWAWNGGGDRRPGVRSARRWGTDRPRRTCRRCAAQPPITSATNPRITTTVTSRKLGFFGSGAAGALVVETPHC